MKAVSTSTVKCFCLLPQNLLQHEITTSNMFDLHTFIVGLLLFVSAVHVQTDLEKRHLYVKPTPTSSGCPENEVCMTLSDYLQNVSDYFTSNTTIHFLPGNHTIESSHDLPIVSNVENMLLFGHAGNTTLYCIERFGLAFVNTTKVYIFNISIRNCGQKIGSLLKSIDFMGYKIPPNTKAALTLVNINSLVLQNVQIKASYGYGLLGVSVSGDLTRCIFTHNMWRSDGDDTSGDKNKPGGNALFVFPLRVNKHIPATLHISQCEFAYGVDETTQDFQAWTEPSIIGGGSGLGIMIYMYRKSLLDSTIQWFGNLKDNTVNISIRDSTFHHNHASHGRGGNVMVFVQTIVKLDKIWITDVNTNRTSPLQKIFLIGINTVGKQLTFRSTIYIDNCSFHSGNALEGGGVFVGTVNIGSSTKTSIKLSNSTIFNNLAEDTGGGLCFESKTADIMDFMIKKNIHLTIENCTFFGNRAIKGGAVYIAYSTQLKSPTATLIEPLAGAISTISSLPAWQNKFLLEEPTIIVTILHGTFLQNTAKNGGGMDVLLYTITRDALKHSMWGVNIVCTDCSFIENKAESGYAMSVRGCGKTYGRKLDKVIGVCSQTYRTSVQLVNTVMKNNGAHIQNVDYCSAVLCIYNTEEVRLSNSVVTENKNSAVYVIGSNIIISGVVKIIDNHGVSGGGLYFDCNPRSFLYLTPHSQLYMANNTASLHGGAIAVKDCSAETIKTKCFIQILDQDEECSSLFNEAITINESRLCNDTKIIMENNTAEAAGDSVYGGLLDRCYMLGNNGDKWIQFSILQTRILEIHNKLSLSELASDPFLVCFCHRNVGSKCINEIKAEVYHGQTLQIPAVAAGQFNNASPAAVQTRITSGQSEILLGETEKFQELGRDCRSLVYQFNLSRKQDSNFELQISIEKSISVIKNSPAVVHVAILNCPPGFELSSDLSTCQCQPHLKTHGIKCDIETQKFNKPAPMWMGYYREEQVTVHTNCPFHYCKSEGNEFTLDNQDDQCAFNHSGVLCGACQQGLSLALGTSQCLKCSNVYLLLLIPFALAGVALVFLLLKCNLTVSVGSINGLIFYANIIQVNHATFFPHGAQSVNFFTNFLSVFIAWMNLDFGIQTCFFTGMTAYTKTWLQFVFPACVWIMVGFMIYGSRHFPTVSRLIGSNAVQVLATLFLLSYAKVLHTVIAATLSTTLTGKNSSTPLVWLLDGNVSFFRGTHTVLILMALVIIIIYIVPLTILVLLVPYLQCNLNYRALRLVSIKLKPLLDAYQRPYKDKFRYWTGVMLLMRAVVFVVFAGNVFGKPEINIFAVIASIQLLGRNVGRVYKNVLWNITESFYLFNLVILSAATLLLRGLDEPSNSSSQEIVTDIMVGTAFAVFCAIMLYHFCVYVLKTSVTLIKIKQAMQTLLRKNHRNQQQPTSLTNDVNPNTPAPSNVHTVSHFELNQLREPLPSDN